ncbi:hypothetical protein F2Q68_00039578 [Brassica cretica]|uniref:Uncharacterized protein n=1 Tax=Brassica cretica TaxID=69181 RepID=A0A8S9MN73_BRACR|nr:hypothetical protein F2Q68_00039578 [Brassica cretica]
MIPAIWVCITFGDELDDAHHQHLLGIPGVRTRIRPPIGEDEAAYISVLGRGESE